MIQVVLAPVLSGIALNHYFPAAVARIAPYAPSVAVFMVALTVATVMAQAAASVRQAGWFLLLVCCSLHAGGFALGYGVSRLLGLQETTCRTNSIEVRSLRCWMPSMHYAVIIVLPRHRPCIMYFAFHMVQVPVASVNAFSERACYLSCCTTHDHRSIASCLVWTERQCTM